MRIDCHAHVHPPDYREGAGRPSRCRPTTLAGLEADMERYEIDAAVISVGPPAAFIGPHQDPIELARAANDGIAEIVRDQPRKFAGLATLPLTQRRRRSE